MSDILRNDPDLWLPLFPWPTAESHKHSRGRLVVISGDAWSTGAARLAARAGLRIGAGVVTMLSPTEALASHAAHLEAIMLRGFDDPGRLAELAQSADAAVIGPAAGVGERTTLNLFALTATGAALVIDADALSSFQDDPDNLFSVLDRDDVLTPHPGEFERLFPGLLEAKGREAAARQASERASAVVILKGAATVVAAPDGRVAVNSNGSAWLATAGTGDVLAGFCAGLIAQGMPSFEAACAAVWLHAQSAGAFGPGLISEDLPDLVPAALNALFVAKAVR